MKIIRLTTLLDFGGQEKQYISFTNQKELLQNEYIFGAIGFGGFAEDDIKRKGFQVKIFDQNPAVSNLKNIWTLYKWFRNEKPDIVHTAVAEANFHGIIAAKLAGVKVIIGEEAGFPNHSTKAKIIFKQVYKFANKVIGVSKSVKDFLVEIQEIEPSKGEVIYNPVTPPKIVDRELQDVFTIVSVGRLEIVKNQQLLITAFSKLKNKYSKLILVGEGRERSNLENLVKKLNLEDRVSITGFTSNPELYLAKADLFVLPSLSEGFGIATVEAMQVGIPCLCSRVGGIPEFIEDGQTGWLFDPESEAELRKKIEDIFEMPSVERKNVGNQGQKAVSTRFSEEIYIKTLEDFYQNLAV